MAPHARPRRRGTLQREARQALCSSLPGPRPSRRALAGLALYLESLTPPPSPHPRDESAARGEALFEQQRCDRCHPAPLYTSNALMPVRGFRPPEDHARRFHLVRESIDTDPTLSLETRRGSGYYKVPSLRGLWYRGPFGHDGSVATLEEWFDPARLESDHVPGGFAGVDGRNRSVPGHRFGLALSPAERRDLIAFLRTL